MNWPAISCAMPTYGRPRHVLENSIQCFLDQDYPGIKELVILNDCDEQEFIFDHPEVKIFNVKTRIKPIGAKFNSTIDLCTYDIIAMWEDDDVFLKHRLTYSVQRMKNGVFHTGDAFWESAPKIIQKTSNLFHSTHMYTRQVYELAGKYDTDKDLCSLDVTFVERLRQKLGFYSQTTEDKDIFYIYIWGGSDSYHSSGYGGNVTNVSDLNEIMVKSKISSNKVEIGDIYLEPKLRYNYYDYLPL